MGYKNIIQEKLKRRFNYIKSIKTFLESKGYFEVITNKLKEEIIKESNIDYIKMDTFYLTPSPEVEIKKLIALGFENIYELNFAYRNDYIDNFHSKEFLMLEWYKTYVKPQYIIDELFNLIKHLNGSNKIRYKENEIDLSNIKFTSYSNLFLSKLKIDIHNINIEELKNRFHIEATDNKLEILDGIFAIHIEKTLGIEHPLVIYDFPKERANLAKIENEVAKRFEIYIAGIELANCYDEENNYLSLRKRMKLSDKTFDNAMALGLPPFSGIAVGVDRLIMILENDNCVFRGIHI